MTDFKFFLYSLFGGLFPLPRIIYAMASDGLLFGFFAKVNERFKTPILSCIFSGALACKEEGKEDSEEKERGKKRGGGRGGGRGKMRV